MAWFEDNELTVVDVLEDPDTGLIDNLLLESSSVAVPLISNRAGRLLLRPENEIKGTDESETLEGSDRSDSISGEGGDDVLLGLGGFDILSGGAGNDWVNGGGNGDFLYGGSGRDIIKGGTGQDYLQGDGGRDRLIGGAGKDQFAIQLGRGVDTIEDYTDGKDTLAIFDDFQFDQLQFVQSGQQTQIQLGDRVLAILENVSASVITADDFTVPLPAIV